MNDLISRQATIDAMEGVDWYHIDKDGQLVHGANSKEDEPLYKAKDVYKVLNDVPSAQPEKRTEERTETHPADREDKVNEPKILDATCGDRTIWFQKNEPHTTYCDIRREEWEGDFGKQLNSNGKKKHRHLVINPDIQCSFTDLPFDDGTFNLVVFDPPHITNLAESSWMRKSYGSLDGDWKPMIHDGFNECMRVLSAGGVLIFKWSDISVSTRDIIKVIGKEPLFGHRSGKKMNTHWMCFMKFDEE